MAPGFRASCSARGRSRPSIRCGSVRPPHSPTLSGIRPGLGRAGQPGNCPEGRPCYFQARHGRSVCGKEYHGPHGGSKKDKDTGSRGTRRRGSAAQTLKFSGAHVFSETSFPWTRVHLRIPL